MTTTQSEKKQIEATPKAIMCPNFIRKKPFRRVCVLVFLFIVIPFSGRMFYLHKLEFARKVSFDLLRSVEKRDDAKGAE